MGVLGWFKRLLGGGGDETSPSTSDAPTVPHSPPDAVTPPHTRDTVLESLEQQLLLHLAKDATPDPSLFDDKTFQENLETLADDDPGAAIRVLRRYATAWPQHVSLHHRLARLYEARVEWSSAQAIWERLAQHPDFAAEAYERLAAIHERQGEPDLAVLFYQRALGHDWTRQGAHEACRRLAEHLPSAASPPPLTIVAHAPPEGFEIEYPLGRGGFGTVYRARDLALQRTVALKFLHAHLRRRPDQVDAFFAEARLVAALGHPGIVQLYELDTERHLLVMEFITHGTLSDRLLSGRPLHAVAALRCTRDLAKTLAFVHSRDIVHRDIKPGNVLFRDAADAVLGDFGVAGLETDRERRRGAGTRGYAAPEVLAGEAADRRADLYALALLLGEMLSAQRPPGDASQRSAWFAQALTALPGPLGAMAAPLLTPLLADAPTARPADSQAVVDMLSFLIDAFEEADDPTVAQHLARVAEALAPRV